MTLVVDMALNLQHSLTLQIDFQVTKLIEDSSATKVGKTAISHVRILEWLVNSKVLSIALEGKNFYFSIVTRHVF